MKKLVLKDDLYISFFYSMLFPVLICLLPLFVFPVLFGLFISFFFILVVLLFLHIFLFQIEIQITPENLKIRTMKTERFFRKEDIKSVLAVFNTSAGMKSCLHIELNSGEKVSYFFYNRYLLTNPYKIIENKALFPNFEYSVVGDMPMREVQINYFNDHLKKMNIVKIFYVATENMNPFARYCLMFFLCLGFLFFCFTIVMLIYSLIQLKALL